MVINAGSAALLFRKEFGPMGQPATSDDAKVPMAVVTVHLLSLLGLVVFAHHPAVFMGLFLFFLGFTTAYQRHQDTLILREALLVAFFLAGLVVLSGQQQ